jgi:hypothetical protein
MPSVDQFVAAFARLSPEDQQLVLALIAALLARP